MEQATALALPMGGPDMGDLPDLAPTPSGLPASFGGSTRLSGRAKAAIVVQLLLNDGVEIPLDSLPEDLQLELTKQMGEMRLVDRQTLNAVAEEFASQLDNVGLSFPDGLAGALHAMKGKISRHTYSRLRREAGVRQFGDPWDRLRKLDAEELAEIAMAESTEVAAVMLSKLETGKAALMLQSLPGPVARRITYAVSHTRNVSPETVDKIGTALAAQIEARPDIAFDETPGQRLGSILTESQSAKREEVLTALGEEDEEFAADVRKSVFTYGLIAKRVDKMDVQKVIRAVTPQDLTIAIAYASEEEDVATSEFLLANMAGRMAANLREEANELGKVKKATGEAAIAMIVSMLRDLVNNGDIELKSEDDEGDG
jgi:flagellar motor switch protein FliG